MPSISKHVKFFCYRTINLATDSVFYKLLYFYNHPEHHEMSYLFQICNSNIFVDDSICVSVKKYKTFSALIYSYINTSRNWKNEKLGGNTTPAGRSVFTQFRVFPIFTSVDITVYQYRKNVLYFFHNIAQRTLTEEWREIFRVDIKLYQHGS